MITSSSSVISTPNLSAEEIADAAHYLEDTRDRLIESAAGLSPEQWEFKPSADCWSIAEITEHVVLIEQRVHAIVESMSDAPEPPVGWEQTAVDALVLREVPRRSRRFQAPVFVRPTQGWSRAEALERFFNSRERNIQLLSASALRGHVLPHPVFGPWDGYQWLLAAGAHSLRHTEQIQEVRASVKFPQTSGAALNPALA